MVNQGAASLKHCNLFKIFHSLWFVPLFPGLLTYHTFSHIHLFSTMWCHFLYKSHSDTGIFFFLMVLKLFYNSHTYYVTCIWLLHSPWREGMSLFSLWDETF
jgi:hypothetical protein